MEHQCQSELNFLLPWYPTDSDSRHRDLCPLTQASTYLRSRSAIPSIPCQLGLLLLPALRWVSSAPRTPEPRQPSSWQPVRRHAQPCLTAGRWQPPLWGGDSRPGAAGCWSGHFVGTSFTGVGLRWRPFWLMGIGQTGCSPFHPPQGMEHPEDHL